MPEVYVGINYSDNSFFACYEKSSRLAYISFENSLQSIGEIISRNFSDNVRINAVLAVPGFFDEQKIDELKKFASNANIHILKIIRTAEAAAMSMLGRKICVVSLNYDSIDVSILQYDFSANQYKIIDQRIDKRLGFKDFAKRFEEYLRPLIQDDFGLDLSSQENSKLDFGKYYELTARIRSLAEESFRNLLNHKEYLARIPNFHQDRSFEIELTKESFDDLSSSLFDQIVDIMRDFIESSNAINNENDISQVIFSSGNMVNLEKILRGTQTGESPEKSAAYGAFLSAKTSNGLPNDDRNRLQREIDSLQREIDSLKKDNDSLRSRLKNGTVEYSRPVQSRESSVKTSASNAKKITDSHQNNQQQQQKNDSLFERRKAETVEYGNKPND